jgi:hypothetical protein
MVLWESLDRLQTVSMDYQRTLKVLKLRARRRRTVLPLLSRMMNSWGKRIRKDRTRLTTQSYSHAPWASSCSHKSQIPTHSLERMKWRLPNPIQSNPGTPWNLTSHPRILKTTWKIKYERPVLETWQRLTVKVRMPKNTRNMFRGVGTCHG